MAFSIEPPVVREQFSYVIVGIHFRDHELPVSRESTTAFITSSGLQPPAVQVNIQKKNDDPGREASWPAGSKRTLTISALARHPT